MVGHFIGNAQWARMVEKYSKINNNLVYEKFFKPNSGIWGNCEILRNFENFVFQLNFEFIKLFFFKPYSGIT